MRVLDHTVTLQSLNEHWKNVILLFQYLHTPYSTAPDAAPENVSATALSSTEIEVSWKQVPYCDQNGVITMYEIKYEPWECELIQYINTNSPVLAMNLTGLEEYVEYDITVRAYTSEGPGPYSDPPVTERTLENGKKFPYSLPTLVSQCLPHHHKMSRRIMSHPLLLYCTG